MIRSSAIPIVLERAVGDGIHSVLLVDADGELLGSCGGPPPVAPRSNGQNTAPSNGSPDKANWPLDAAFVGALISEVASDYRRMGEELLLLDPQLDSVRRQSSLDASSNGGSQKGVSTDMNNNSKGKDDKIIAEGANLRSLVIELDHVSGKQASRVR